MIVDRSTPPKPHEIRVKQVEYANLEAKPGTTLFTMVPGWKTTVENLNIYMLVSNLK